MPKGQEPSQENDQDAKRMGFIKIGTPPPPKTQTTPVLKLNTNITTTPRLIKPKPKAVPQSSGATESNGARQNNSSIDGESRSNPDAVEIKFDFSEMATEKGDGTFEDEDRTPHPLRDGPVRPSMFWPNGNTLGQSIDEMLSPCDYRQSQRLRPLTPNGYDDISPITRGEWGFLFKGDTWTQGRTAVVETC